jgi:hypothetical protein
LPASGEPHVGGAPPVSPGGDPNRPQKQGWSERLHQMGMKAADPINALAHKLGSQSFLPMPLDKECEKAAIILSSFCSKSKLAQARFKGCC